MYFKILAILTHVLKNEIDVTVIVSSVHIEKPNNVWMIAEMLEKDDFSERALRIGLVAKGVCK